MSHSPYKVLNELEKKYQDNYSASVLTLSKAILTEIDKEVKENKKKK